MTTFFKTSLLDAALEDNGDTITLSNISPRLLERDLYRVFRSSRVYNYLFQEKGWYSLTMHKFFILEFYYVLETLEANRELYTAIKKIREIKQLLKEKTWLKDVDTKHADIVHFSDLSAFKLKPLPHQSEFFHKFNTTIPQYKLKGLLLAAEPGSGKTYASLALAKCLRVPRVIVVCPLNAVETVWLKSITGKDSLYHKPPTVWRADSGQPYRGEYVMLCHYEALGKLLSVVKQNRSTESTIILDESHNLNEMTSQRTRNFIDLCSLVQGYVVLASGTPIKALATETVPLLRTIDPLFTEEVSELFKKLYRGEVSAMTAVLNRRLNIVSHRVGASALKLKEPSINYLKVKTPNSHLYTLVAIREDMLVYAKKRLKEITSTMESRRQHFFDTVAGCRERLIGDPRLNESSKAAIKQEFIVYLECASAVKRAHDTGGLQSMTEEMKRCQVFERTYLYPNISDKEELARFKETVVIFKYYRLKIQGECLGRVLGRKRIDAYREISRCVPYADMIESSEKKTLVFTSFIEVVEDCAETLREQGYKPLKVYGDHIRELADIVETYHNKASANPLVATYNSLSTAVPLTMADTLIAINPPYREYIMKQAIARIHRIGTTTETRVFHVSLDTEGLPNISDRMLDIVKWSKEQSQAILNLNADIDYEDNAEDIAQEGLCEEGVVPYEVLPEGLPA